jgi:hypothetical protein
MHLEYLRGSPLDKGPPLSVAPAGDAVVVVVPSLATPALDEPPPQAAVVRARPMTAGATSSRRSPSPLLTSTAMARCGRRTGGSRCNCMRSWPIGRTVPKDR